MNTLWIFSIEPIETRYTCQWYKHVPALFKKHAGKQMKVEQINGDTMPGKLQNGEFLDFASTNQWKNEQANKFLKLMKAGKVQKGDHLLFLDAWNPSITELKYVNDLRGMKWKMHGLWHAGSYDPQDFLGRLVGNADWVRNLERSLYYSLDYSYFATEYHAKLFTDQLKVDNSKIVLTGWPFEYLEDEITKVKAGPKRDLILFPHRIAPEKQLAIFEDLAKALPQYEWVVCQKMGLPKQKYHKMLMEAKMVFSANLQETLGISTCGEGPVAGAIPLAPNRLSYSDVFEGHYEFTYPSAWTLNWEKYKANKTKLVDKIEYVMTKYELYSGALEYYLDTNYMKFFTAQNLVSNILK